MNKQRLTAPEGARFIADLPKRLEEIGKIKMGYRDRGNKKQKSSGEGHWYPPKASDQFMIQTTELDDEGFNFPDIDALEKLGVEPKKDKRENWYTEPKLTEIDIIFPFNDPNLILQTAYKYYTGSRAICWGNGNVANRLTKTGDTKEVGCPCEFLDAGKCKINGRLSCMLAKCSIIGGIYVLRTTGFNTTVNLQTSILGLANLTNNRLAGIPLKLILKMKKSEYEDDQGKMRPTVFPVATVVFLGDPRQLIEESHQLYSLTVPGQRRNVELELLKEGQTVESTEEQDINNQEFSPGTINEDPGFADLNAKNNSDKQENKQQTNLLED